MVVGGVPNQTDQHSALVADFALDALEILKKYNSEADSDISVRIGINTGSVIAGVIGKRKFAYDLWGNAVNVASRMESTGASNRIQITDSTYKLLLKSNKFVMKKRGIVKVKGKGEMITYWLQRRISDPVPDDDYSSEEDTEEDIGIMTAPKTLPPLSEQRLPGAHLKMNNLSKSSQRVEPPSVSRNPPRYMAPKVNAKIAVPSRGYNNQLDKNKQKNKVQPPQQMEQYSQVTYVRQSTL